MLLSRDSYFSAISLLAALLLSSLLGAGPVSASQNILIMAEDAAIHTLPRSEQ